MLDKQTFDQFCGHRGGNHAFNHDDAPLAGHTGGTVSAQPCGQGRRAAHRPSAHLSRLTPKRQ
ncbi:hypothetical protein, partial [Rivihabitans pingtungensis]|uniref:hypothetical protein n=1 Tax=Rivihabitans pingtungensis TaxID=1054498 RepID=UPI002FDA9EC0